MSTIFRKRISFIILIGLFVLAGCGGGGGGGNGTVGPAGDGGVGVVPTNDTFNWTGNTSMTTAAVNGVLANDPAGTVIASADTTTALGGTVNVTTATGAFTYDPPPGTQNASDSFTYTVTGFAPVTVTINLVERVWYVDNSVANGNGTFNSPFNTVVQAQNASDVNDTIFVFAGVSDTGQDLGITLKAGQKLLGKGVGLKVSDVPLVDPAANTLISNAGLGVGLDIPVVMLATGNEVAGFTINAAFNEGILAVGGTGHNLHDNVINFGANGREGIRLLSVTGNNSVFFNTITGAQRDGIKLVNNENQAGDPVVATPIAATVTMSKNTITGSAQDGITANLDGAGTNVTLNMMTNTINNSGAVNANEGIDVDSLGAASVTAVVSRNIISNSALEAMDLSAAGASPMRAFVANNDLSLNGGLADFRNRTLAASTATMCTELDNNSNAALNSTFQVENNSGGLFQLFEGVNDTAVVAVGAITPVPAGTCNIALNGAELFKANCTICHTGNGLGLETKKTNIAPDITNRTAADINFQLANNLSMSDIRLTQREIDAIAAALSTGP